MNHEHFGRTLPTTNNSSCGHLRRKRKKQQQRFRGLWGFWVQAPPPPPPPNQGVFLLCLFVFFFLFFPFFSFPLPYLSLFHFFFFHCSIVALQQQLFLKPCPHCTIKPVSPVSGTGSTRPHYTRFHPNGFHLDSPETFRRVGFKRLRFIEH